MASARYAWGIDIGNRALKAVKLVREGDTLRVDDFELIEHETVLSNSGDNRETFIQSALASFVQRHQTKGAAIAVGVSGQQSFARFIKLPPVETKKIPEIVRFEAIQQIPFPLDDVEWSYQLFQHPESPDVEVGIFAMRKELVNQHIKNFTDFDLNVQVVQMNPLAVYNAMNYDGRLDKGTTMIIDLGAENTDLIIADKESIWMRSIPIGGNNFTQTLEKAFKLPFAKAEDLKRNAATSKYARQIFQAMRPVFADLVAEIQRSVGFYASVHRDSRIRKIMALGGTFKLPGLQKYLQQNLQLDVERPDHVAAGAPADPKLASTFQENLLSVVSAYGLAVQAMGEAKITSSLLPQRIRREKMWKEKTKWFAATAALFVLGTTIPAGAYFLHKFQYDQSDKYRSEAEQVLSRARTLDSQWSEVESAGSAERVRVANIRSMLSYRDLQQRLLMDINQALPRPQKPVLEGLQMIGTDTEAGIRLIKQIPREKREQIIINSVSMQYQPSIAAALTSTARDLLDGQDDQGMMPPAMEQGPTEGMPPQMPGEGVPGMGGAGYIDPGAFEGGPPPPPVEQPPPESYGGGEQMEGGEYTEGGDGTARRGYVITIVGTSPHAVALEDLVQNKFIRSLLAVRPNKAEPNKPYAIRRATLVTGMQLNQDPNRLQRLEQEYLTQRRAREMGARGEPGAVPGGEQLPPWATERPPQPGAPGEPAEGEGETVPPAFQDRLLGEDIRNDFEFTLTLVVELDPAPFVPGEQPADGAVPAAGEIPADNGSPEPGDEPSAEAR